MATSACLVRMLEWGGCPPKAPEALRRAHFMEGAALVSGAEGVARRGAMGGGPGTARGARGPLPKPHADETVGKERCTMGGGPGGGAERPPSAAEAVRGDRCAMSGGRWRRG